MKISVIVPAYNEGATLGRCIEDIYDKNPGLDLEVIVIDDGSKDATEKTARSIEKPGFRYLRHAINRGKGAAIRTGLQAARGDVVLIQDADLEYNPADYRKLLAPIESGQVQVVYGSRILKKDNPKASQIYYLGGRFLSLWTNLLYGSHITDEPTCYKAFKTEILRSLNLTCAGFEFCPEVTAKILRRKIPILEVPISYNPRSVEQGKKIRWHDGLRAIWTLLKFRFMR